MGKTLKRKELVGRYFPESSKVVESVMNQPYFVREAILDLERYIDYPQHIRNHIQDEGLNTEHLLVPLGSGDNYIEVEIPLPTRKVYSDEELKILLVIYTFRSVIKKACSMQGTIAPLLQALKKKKKCSFIEYTREPV